MQNPAYEKLGVQEYFIYSILEPENSFRLLMKKLRPECAPSRKLKGYARKSRRLSRNP